jgi:hypothetical protein
MSIIAKEAGSSIVNLQKTPEYRLDFSDSHPEGEIDKESLTYPWSFKDLIVVLGGIAGIFLACMIIIGILLRPLILVETTTPLPVQTIALAAAESIALIGGVYFFAILRKGLTWKDLGLKPPSTGWIFTSIGISIVAIPLSGLITLTIMLLLDLPLENPQLDILLPEKITSLEMGGMILFAGVIAPIGEEFLFRGLLYPFLRNKWGILPGVFISALIFALAHLNILIGINAFLLGIVLAILFEYSRSLWISGMLHILNNTMRLAILYLFVRSGVAMLLAI